MEGCKTILYSDCRQLAVTLHESQTNGFLWTESTQSQTTKQDIYPHLAGGEMPITLPIAVRSFNFYLD